MHFLPRRALAAFFVAASTVISVITACVAVIGSAKAVANSKVFKNVIGIPLLVRLVS